MDVSAIAGLPVTDGRSTDTTRAKYLAVVSNRAEIARRIGTADAPAVQDQRVGGDASIRPEAAARRAGARPRPDPRFSTSPIRFDTRSTCRSTGRPGTPSAWPKHDVGRLAPDARQLRERVHVGGHVAAVLADQRACRGHDRLRLLPEEAGLRRSAARSLRRLDAGQRARVRILRKERRRDHVHRARRWTAPRGSSRSAARTRCGSGARYRHRDADVSRRARIVTGGRCGRGYREPRLNARAPVVRTPSMARSCSCSAASSVGTLCNGSTMRARTGRADHMIGARRDSTLFDVLLRERLHFAERQRAIERRVRDGAEIGVGALDPRSSSGTIVKLICLRSDMPAEIYIELRRLSGCSVSPHDADHDSLHLHLVRRDDDRLHGRIGWLQTHMAVLAIELLQRHVVPPSRAITISPLSADFRSSTMTKSPSRICSSIIELPAPAARRYPARPTMSSGTAIVSLRQPPRWARPRRRTRAAAVRRARLPFESDELDRSAAVPCALDEPLLLQVGQVLVHRGQRRQTEPAADFLEARRIAVLLNELIQVIEDLALALGEREHARMIRKQKAKINRHAPDRPW